LQELRETAARIKVAKAKTVLFIIRLCLR